jgi:hypothetical protein
MYSGLSPNDDEPAMAAAGSTFFKLEIVVVEPLADGVALFAGTLLDDTDQLVLASFGLHQIVVSDLSPFALDVALDLIPFTLQSIAVH